MRPRSLARLSGALLLMTAVTSGCDASSPAAPSAEPDTTGTLFSRPADLSALRTRAAAAPLRLEIDVLPGGAPLIAREVEVENDDDDEEKIESRIVGADRARATLRLALGGLETDASVAVRFRSEGGAELSRAAFFDRVEAALASGRQPGVELRRRLPSTPQAPDDATFVVRDVRLDDDADFGKLEVLVDARHLSVDGSDRGRIRVLGLEIVVDPALGSSVAERTATGDGAVEFEGLVAAVDPAVGRVALVGGDEVRVEARTRIDDSGLRSLGAVQDALRAGHWVEVEAEAVRGPDGGWVAVKIEFEVEDDPDGLSGSGEFEGLVSEADPGAGSFRLADGRSYTVSERTRFEVDGDLFGLAGVAAALAGGVRVEAEGRVVPDAAAPGGAWLVTVKFETGTGGGDDGSGDDGSDDGDSGDDGGTGGAVAEFEGLLATVDAGAGRFTLAGGTSFAVTDATEYEADGDLFSLSAAAAVLAAGGVVRVEGDAVRDAAASLWRVVRMKIEVDD